MVFQHICADASASSAIWLDSSLQQSSTYPATQSILCPSTGPLASLVSYRIATHTWEITGTNPVAQHLRALADHPGMDLFTFLRAGLDYITPIHGLDSTASPSVHPQSTAAQSAPAGSGTDCVTTSEGGSASDLGFNLGWVGALGYELKHLTAGVQHSPTAVADPHRSPISDAHMLFADRAVVIDHSHHHTYLLALTCGDPHTDSLQHAWLRSTALYLRDFSSAPGIAAQGTPVASALNQPPVGFQAPAHTTPAATQTYAPTPVAPSTPAQSPTPSTPLPATLTPVAPPTPSQSPSSTTLAEATPTPPTPPAPPAAPIPFRLDHSHTDYMHCVRQAKASIAAGESYEVCLTTTAEGPPLADPFRTYLTLRRTSPAPFGAYLRFGHTHVLSSSPERFLKVTRRGKICAKPIKGTRARGKEPHQDLQLRQELRTCTKDRAENLMIVDLLRNDLSQVARPGSVHVPQLFQVESYSHVHQLVSTVQAQLAHGLHAVDALRAAFPGGSMTGAPKIRTMELMEGWERRARGLYSGAIGWLSLGGAAEFSITIRTLVVTPHSSTFGVGGAIVADSDPHAEWNEVLLKAQTVLDGVGGVLVGAHTSLKP